jgi:hypothetical protein
MMQARIRSAAHSTMFHNHGVLRTMPRGFVRPAWRGRIGQWTSLGESQRVHLGVITSLLRDPASL